MTIRPTDQRTKRGVESRSTQLKIISHHFFGRDDVTNQTLYNVLKVSFDSPPKKFHPTNQPTNQPTYHACFAQNSIPAQIQWERIVDWASFFRYLFFPETCYFVSSLWNACRCSFFLSFQRSYEVVCKFCYTLIFFWSLLVSFQVRHKRHVRETRSDHLKTFIRKLFKQGQLGSLGR